MAKTLQLVNYDLAWPARFAVTGGEAAPGGGEGWATLTAVRWLPLDDAAAWKSELCADPFLHPQLLRIRAALEGRRVAGDR